MNSTLKILGIILIGVMAFGCISAPNNQDAEWRESARTGILILGTDLVDLGGHYETLDATSIMTSSVYMAINCESALRNSQSYTVSESLTTAKQEYECGLSDYIMMADLSYDAAMRWSDGDISNAVTEMDHMATYLESGARHIEAATFALG